MNAPRPWLVVSGAMALGVGAAIGGSVVALNDSPGQVIGDAVVLSADTTLDGEDPLDSADTPVDSEDDSTDSAYDSPAVSPHADSTSATDAAAVAPAPVPQPTSPRVSAVSDDTPPLADSAASAVSADSADSPDSAGSA